MLIITTEEFQRQAQSRNDLPGKIYHKKVLMPGVIFSAKYKQAAINYCRRWMTKNPAFLCILVEDSHQIQVWYENFKRQNTDQIPDEVKPKDNNIFSLFKSKNLPIDKEFVAHCQQILAEEIGPIARVMIKKVLAQNTKANREQFIISLINELRQRQQLIEVEEKLNDFLHHQIEDF